ncbi:hypothetical protein JST97_16710 [bacterium]|nr:hypothetical protein [bacterium]
MRALLLIWLVSWGAFAEPRWQPLGNGQVRQGRFYFEWGSLAVWPGVSWEKEVDTPSDRWHYVGVRSNRVCHLFILPPEVADPPTTRQIFNQLVPESQDFQLIYSQVPLGGSYWMPFRAPEWQGTLVVAHVIPATLAWLDMGAQPTAPEFKEWLKSFRPSPQLESFRAPLARPLPQARTGKASSARSKSPSPNQKLQALARALTFWPIFLLIPLGLKARKERDRQAYSRQVFGLLILPPGLAFILLLLADSWSGQWFPDPAQRAAAFKYVAFRALGFALLGPLGVLLVRRFRPRRKRRVHSRRGSRRD